MVRNRDNRGFAAAANQALRAGSGEWVLALNPDCRLAPDYLASSAGGGRRAGARRVRDRSAPAGRRGGPRDRATWWTPPGSSSPPPGAISTAHPATTLDRRVAAPAWVFGASGAAALYRRAALEDVAYPGGEVFDEGFFSYREDADLAWRLQRRGWRCLYWPAARAAHGRGLKPEARRHGSAAINRHSVRNRFLLRLANADWRWHLACFPFWLLRDAAVVAACLTVERTSLPGLAEAWRLRRAQRERGRANAARATVSGWAMARWFVPGRRVERLG